MTRFIIGLFLLCSVQLAAFDQVVIWGHKLHSHTHSYIHNAFFSAFQEMGYKTYWFDNADNVQDFNFSNSLFLTEGQVDQHIPLRDDCIYILHNCCSPKYKPYFSSNKAFSLQVYTDDVLTREGCEKIAPCIYYDLKGKCVYMPWATDLLPREIEEVKRKISATKKTRDIHWVGTIGGGEFGNIEQITPFKNAAEAFGVTFQSKGSLSMNDHMDFIRSAYIAPAIVGRWQQEKGYIPCRIFKNISYGQMGITNSFRVYELFDKKIVYNENSEHLFLDARKKMELMSLQELYDLIDFVKENHTYINRVETLLNFQSLLGNY